MAKLLACHLIGIPFQPAPSPRQTFALQLSTWCFPGGCKWNQLVQRDANFFISCYVSKPLITHTGEQNLQASADTLVMQVLVIMRRTSLQGDLGLEYFMDYWLGLLKTDDLLAIHELSNLTEPVQLPYIGEAEITFLSWDWEIRIRANNRH